MLADHTSCVPSIAARFTSKARAVAHVFLRQHGSVKYLVAHHIRDRHLCCRNQVEVALVIEFEQVFLKLRLLPGTSKRFPVNDVRDVDFLITVFNGMHIQHELNQRSLKLCQLPTQGHKA